MYFGKKVFFKGCFGLIDLDFFNCVGVMMFICKVIRKYWGGNISNIGVFIFGKIEGF